MDWLWTPWRYGYVSRAAKTDRCIFCENSKPGADERNLVVFRGEFNLVMLNLFPYTNGHLMIVPYAHLAEFEDLPDETAAEMMRLAQSTVRRLKAVYKPHGMNVGMNLGESAGAGVAGHLHLHAVPRWTGDSSFMTTIGETRVMPEDIHETYRKLKAAFADG